MSQPSPRKLIFGHLAEVAKSLGHPYRLELLQFISQGERSVERLSELTGLSVANTSQHLQHLRRAGMVRTRRDGKHIFYGLASPQILTLIDALSAVAEESSAEVKLILSDYFNNLDALEPISREDLLERVRDGNIVVLDARPEDEYAMGHLPGAIRVDDSALEEALATLPTDQAIVAYCRGTYCVSSFKVVSKLRSLGYDVRRMEKGFPEWQAAGFEIETGSGPDGEAVNEHLDRSRN